MAQPDSDFKNRYVFITAYYALSLQEYHMDLHAHSSAEIMYVTGGSCLVSGSDFSAALSANEFIFLPSGVLHRLTVTPEHPCTILNLEFRIQSEKTFLPLHELLTNCPALLPWPTRCSCAAAQEQRALGYAMKDLISQLQRKEDSPYLLRLLFYRVMLELLYCMTHDRKMAGTLYIQKACSYIEQNLSQELSIPAIASYTGVNKSYLQLLFSRLLGCSIGNYITQKRLELATFLLTNSSLSVTDIAFSSGYNSRQHFTHAFEKAFHLSPSAYRRLHCRSLLPDTEESQCLFNENGEELRRSMY